jgi:hypothetical protein
MNNFLKICLPLLLLFVIALAGCNIFPRYGNSSPINTQQATIVFKTEFSGNNDIDFSNSEISLKISKSALNKSQEIKILKYPNNSFIKVPDKFEIITDLYQIKLDDKLIKSPASISFYLKEDYDAETIFALVQSTQESEARLVSPTLIEGKNTFTFATSIFSFWCLVQRQEKESTGPVSAPILTINPSKLMTDLDGYFSCVPLIRTSFSLATSTNSFNSNDYQFSIEFLAQQSFQLKLASQNKTEVFTSTLNPTELHGIEVSIFEQNSIDVDLINNLASATARLMLTEYMPANMPDLIVVKSKVKDKKGNIYETNMPLNLTSQTDPDLTKNFPVLLSSLPRTGEKNFPINDPFILKFNKAINEQSFSDALSISPAIDTDSKFLSWNQDSTIVTITPQSSLQPQTNYRIQLGTNLKDTENNFLKQSIQIEFTTAEASAPVLQDFFPPTDQQLALNGSIQLAFDEVIATSSLLYTISPQIETKAEFAGKYISIYPLESWPANTSFEIKLEKGISDLYGNKTQADILKSFTTSDVDAAIIKAFNPINGYTNASISTSIKIDFDQPMNTISTVQALEFSGNSPSTDFLWQDNNQKLIISYAKLLKNDETYEIIIDNSAETEDGTRLASKYSYQFKTMTAPEILYTSLIPASGAVNVATDTSIIIPFSRQMNTSTPQFFNLIQSNGSTVEGSFSWNQNEMQFAPKDLLLPDQTYRVSLDAAAKDIFANPLNEDLTYKFTTKANERVFVENTVPANGSIDIAQDSPLSFYFSGPVIPESFAFDIMPQIPGTKEISWHNNDRMVNIIFNAGFAGNTTYEVSVSNQTKDKLEQHIIQPDPISFTTVDSINPRLLSTIPASGSAKISPLTSIKLEFDKSMNTDSIVSAFGLEPESSSNPGFTWNEHYTQTEINFELPLQFSTNYKILLSDKAADSEGNYIAKSLTIPFTTRKQTKITEVLPASNSTQISPDTEIKIVFSHAVDQSQSEQLFYAKTSDSLIEGSFNWSNNSLVFSPGEKLPFNSRIFFGFNSGLLDYENLNVDTSGTFSFTTMDAIAPEIVSTVPLNGATDVSYNSEIEITFSQKMATNSVSININPNIDNLNANWNEDCKTLILSGAIFTENTSYSIAISPESQSQAGRAISGDLSFSFTTGKFAGPKIIKTIPAQNSTNIAVNSSITLEFDREIASQTLFDSLAFSPATTYNATFDANNAIITPVNKLQFSSAYNLELNTALTDTEGIHLDEAYTLCFETEPMPAVTSVLPQNNEQNIQTDIIIKVDFNKIMNSETVVNAFELLNGLDTVQCSFTWENQNKRLLCQPVTNLTKGQTYTIIFNTSATDINGNNLGAKFQSKFTTVAPPPLNAEFTSPVSGSTDVPVNQQIVASFSNAIQTPSLAIEFTPALSSGYSPAWSNNNRMVTITPASPLSSEQNYTVKILAETTDIYSQTLSTDKTISFTTMSQSAPEITFSEPSAGSYDVALDKAISITFSKAMNTDSVEQAFSISPQVGNETNFNWANTNKNLQISFDQNFADATSYSVVIASESRDLSDIAMGYDFLLPFTTIARPKLLTDQLYPKDSAENIPIQTKVQMTFSKVMNLDSVINSFTMANNTESVSGTFAQDQTIITFTPDQNLEYNTTYNLSIDSSAKDNSGNLLKSAYTWAFTTEAQQGEVWTYENDLATFTERINHSMVSFNNELYIIGGYDGSYLNDVWKSSDGKNWNRILSANGTGSTNQFSPRSGHACAVFNEKIWLTGGMASDTIYHDDVWSSADGENWTKENAAAEYYQRAFHNLQVFDGKLWIIAGETIDSSQNTVLLDDCWNSTDGINWVQRSDIVSFFPRKHAGSGVIDDKLWVWGGYGKNSSMQTQALNDSWYTTNGDVWTLARENCDFSARLGMATTAFSNKIWMLGGTDNISISNSNYLDEIWTTVDGVSWYQVNTTTVFSPRAHTSASPLANKLFISGGESTSGFFNEVWSTLK